MFDVNRRSQGSGEIKEVRSKSLRISTREKEEECRGGKIVEI